MLKILSYLNIALSIAYFLTYLLNSYSWPIIAIMILIIYHGLVIRNLEKEARFQPVHYILGSACLLFAGFLILGLVNMVNSAIFGGYFKEIQGYVAFSGPFALCIILQFILMLSSKPEF